MTCTYCNGTRNVVLEGYDYECPACIQTAEKTEGISVMINTLESVRNGHILSGDWIGAGALGDVIHRLKNLNT